MEVKVTEAQLFEKIGRLQIEAEMRSAREASLIELINKLREPAEVQAEPTPLSKRVKKSPTT